MSPLSPWWRRPWSRSLDRVIPRLLWTLAGNFRKEARNCVIVSNVGVSGHTEAALGSPPIIALGLPFPSLETIRIFLSGGTTHAPSMSKPLHVCESFTR